MANAYMMRQDGKLYPVTIHYYAGEYEEAIQTSEWLYNATMFPETKNLIVNFLAAYAKDQDEELQPEEVAPTLKYIMKRLPYKTISEAFIDTLTPKFEALSLDGLNSDALHTAVNDALNQEFARMRIGGMFDTSAGSKALYFRLSSTGFNWFNNIWAYVYDNKSHFDAVTVMRDPEATGTDRQFYRHNGKLVKDMPVDEFINLSGRPVFDSKAVKENPEPLFGGISTGALMKVHRAFIRMAENIDPNF